MSKSNQLETDLLKLIFNNTTMSGVGDATGLVGSAVAGSLYLSLHTADPGETGDQTTNETTYTGGYARQAVARSSAGFTVSGNAVSLAANTVFGTPSGGLQTLTHFGIGTASSGAGKLLYSAALSASYALVSGVPPVLTTALTVNED